MTLYHKKLKFTYIKYTIITLLCCMLFLKGYTPFERTGDNFFKVYLNEEFVGTTGSIEEANNLLVEARREIAKESEELVFIKADLSFEGEEILFGTIDNEEDVQLRIKEVLETNILETMQRTYTVKVNQYMVNLESLDAVKTLFQTAIDNYDTEGEFGVELVQDTSREFNVLTTSVLTKKEHEEEKKVEVSYSGGVQSVLDSFCMEKTDAQAEKDFEDYELGLKAMGFSESIEIAEGFQPVSQIMDLETAINRVTKEQETASEYEVEAGDTLSEIAIKVNIPMESIVAMNDSLEDINTPIHIGDKLVITVPKPELSVERVEENYYEEIYDADIIYVDNDDWYTTQTQVLQQPSAGFRKVVADVHYTNTKEISRVILKEEIVMEAVPKIVERGTKIPPTYIKPISGGRKTSGFGRRKAPTKGASSYHKGVDWSTPKGTPVYASSGGTVAKAGWGSGYGYVVYINHADGRQTRYGHLSKVQCKVGQTVKQGEQIALSGNTGVSTGPHLHFEILINGSQVDPLKYLN